MTNPMESVLSTRSASTGRPLMGLTVLVVEDSRFASEAMRLLCLRSGARIRRADSLRAARRHLAVFRPTVVIVDLGLPDGNGAELIAELARAHPRVGVLLGMSGDAGARAMCNAAGADGFIEKPIASLSAFQAEVISHLPVDMRPRGMRLVSDDRVDPDPLALLDDLAHVSDLLTDTDHLDQNSVRYAVQFLQGLARLTDDGSLSDMADQLSAHHFSGEPISGDIARFAGLVQQRIAQQRAV